MAFMLKELFILTLVVSALTFPWREKFENMHYPEDPMDRVVEDPELIEPKVHDVAQDSNPPPKEVYPVDDTRMDELEEVYPLTNTTRDEAKIEEPPPDNPKEVYPLTNAKRAPRMKRGATNNPDYRWDVTKEGGQNIVKIPYVSSVTGDAKRWLDTVIYELFQDTCVSLRPKTNSDNHYVEFRTGKGGCSSFVGRRLSEKPQYVDLGVGCEFRKTVAHEIMHLLGFYHEQSRADRDKSIYVYFDNIKPGLESQFDIKSQDNLGFPYDISSDMQYNEHAFAIGNPPLNTMEAKNGQPLGQTSHLDAMDINKINTLYQCQRPNFVDHTIVLKTANSWLAGTDEDPFLMLIGSNGKTPFELITSGGKLYANENEQGDEQTHKIPFPDVGTIISVKVTLVPQGQHPPENGKRFFHTTPARRQHQKRWFSGWSLEFVKVDNIKFGGADLDEGEEATLTKKP